MTERRLSKDRVDFARELADQLSEVIAEKDLRWQAVFRKGFAEFKRRGDYITLVVDLSWRKTARFAVKLPEGPTALSLVNRYPYLEES